MVSVDSAIKKACKLFYDKGDTEKSVLLLDDLYQCDKNNSKILDNYLPLLSYCNTEKLKNILASRIKQCEGKYVANINLALSSHNYKKAEKILSLLRTYKKNSIWINFFM